MDVHANVLPWRVDLRFFFLSMEQAEKRCWVFKITSKMKGLRQEALFETRRDSSPSKRKISDAALTCFDCKPPQKSHVMMWPVCQLIHGALVVPSKAAGRWGLLSSDIREKHVRVRKIKSHESAYRSCQTDTQSQTKRKKKSRFWRKQLVLTSYGEPTKFSNLKSLLVAKYQLNKSAWR